MKIAVKLQELLQQPETGILTISTLLAQKLGIIDCTDVHSVTTEQLNLIFTSIPKEWDVELKEIWFLRWFYGTALKSQFYRKTQKPKIQSQQ